MSDLHATVALARGDFDLEVSLEARAGVTLALLGPNGSGKTTLLRAVAGLLPPERGRVTLGEQVWVDTGSNFHLPTRARRIGFVFQSLALFPTMSVQDNVAFGAGGGGVDVLARVGIAHLAERRPPELSGGESQLVALARALASQPEVLMLDEPLAALDVHNRAAARRVLRDALASHSGVRILVTHDPLEAAALADEVAILEQGRIVHRGRMSDIGAHPRSRFAASLAGVNLLRGTLRSESRSRLLQGADFALVVASELKDGTEALATVHPHSIALAPDRPSGSVRNVFEATVADLDTWGQVVRVRLDSSPPLTAEITAAAASDLRLRPGLGLWASVKATEIEVFPA